MATVVQMIKRVVQSKGIRQDIVEKDYALSYLLAAIAATDGLSENLVLKGGTALKKLYFKNYRFSEDLDYSTRAIGPVQQIDSLMQAVVVQMTSALNERGPFQVNLEPLTLTHPHPKDQKAYHVRVQFPQHRQPLCRLKVEITTDEPILLPVDTRTVIHGFAEDFHADVPGYSLKEISAEKLRALLQSRARLKERGWGASRVCRDYYDLWILLHQSGVCSPNLIPLIQQKCIVRNVSFNSPTEFIADELLSVARNEWVQQLLPFVPDAPPIERCLSEVKTLILSMWK